MNAKPTYRLILGSSSVSRKTVLQNVGLPFIQIIPDIDETAFPNEPPTEHVCRLAREKAQAVLQKYQTRPEPALIIASDQVALVNGEIVGKPHTAEKAFEVLQKLSGQTIFFYNGISVLNTHTLEQVTRLTHTKVSFRLLSDAEIRAYLQREQPLSCAGSFKSEGLGIALVERIIGDDPHGLIGLPIIEVFKIFREMGIEPLLTEFRSIESAIF